VLLPDQINNNDEQLTPVQVQRKAGAVQGTIEQTAKQCKD